MVNLLSISFTFAQYKYDIKEWYSRYWDWYWISPKWSYDVLSI